MPNFVETCASVEYAPARMRRGWLAGRAGALQEREFRLLFVGQTLSQIGSSILPIALIFAVLEFGSASALGIVSAALLIPNLCLMLFGGVWADRLPRQKVMLYADLVRGASQAVAAFLLIAGGAAVWNFALLAAMYGTANAFFNPASTGLVPDTVSAPRLQQANALNSISRTSCAVLGPAIGGALVALVGAGSVFALDSVSFVLSAFFLARLRVPRRTVTRTGMRSELARGWHEVRSRNWIWISIGYFGIWNLAFAPYWILGPIVAKRDLGGAADWALVMTLAAAGGIAGGFVALRFKPRYPLRTGYLLIALYALPLLLIARPFPAVVIGIGAAIGAATLEISNTLWFTTLQERVPRDALSRVSAYEWLGSLIFQPLGFVLAGPLAGLFGIRPTLIGAACVLVLSALVVITVPSVRDLRRGEPESAAEDLAVAV
jgi:MFS family permease